MDLSLSGQSPDAEWRHRAAPPGLGPRVGARVASPRRPILRPGPSSLLRATALGQFTAEEDKRVSREQTGQRGQTGQEDKHVEEDRLESVPPVVEMCGGLPGHFHATRGWCPVPCSRIDGGMINAVQRHPAARMQRGRERGQGREPGQNNLLPGRRMKRGQNEKGSERLLRAQRVGSETVLTPVNNRSDPFEFLTPSTFDPFDFL
jgi:hypothetical protein